MNAEDDDDDGVDNSLTLSSWRMRSLLPLTTRDNATRLMPMCLAKSVTEMFDPSNTPSFKTAPGWGGLCMVVMVHSFFLVIVLIVNQFSVFAYKPKR